MAGRNGIQSLRASDDGEQGLAVPPPPMSFSADGAQLVVGASADGGRLYARFLRRCARVPVLAHRQPDRGGSSPQRVFGCSNFPDRLVISTTKFERMVSQARGLRDRLVSTGLTDQLN